MRQSLRINQYIFQSTLSMRRATWTCKDCAYADVISIHALHEESDPIFDENYRAKLFQSTLSMRRATLAILRTAHVT